MIPIVQYRFQRMKAIREGRPLHSPKGFVRGEWSSRHRYRARVFPPDHLQLSRHGSAFSSGRGCGWVLRAWVVVLAIAFQRRGIVSFRSLMK
jgi:hypothetical protein